MRQPTIVNQPPISLIIPDNISASDPNHTLARVLKAQHQPPTPTFDLSHTETHKPSGCIYSQSPIDRDDEPRFATIHESLIDSRDKRYRDDEDDEPLFATEWSAFGASLKVYHFSSAHLANLNRQHIIADHHGCTPSDVALSERTKPFPHPTARLSSEQRSAMCAHLTERRDHEREEKTIKREAEWRCELASWPPFIPRNPINTPQLVLRDLGTLNIASPVKPFVGDYLAEVNPETCAHPNLHSFTFSTGQTIKMCADCTAFDKQRIAQLKTGSIPKAQMLRWEERLEAEGLPKELPHNPIVSFYSSVKMDKIEHVREAEEKASQAKNNYRASQIRRDVKTNTEATRNCLGCGMIFVPSRKAQIYHSDSCRKQHHKKMKRRRNGDSYV